MNRLFFNFSVPVIIIAVIFITGCVKEVDAPIDDVMVDTIPFYRKGELAYKMNVEKADKKVEISEEDQAKLDKIRAEMEARKRKGTFMDKGFDPWVSPVTRTTADLPRAMRTLPVDNFGYPDWSRAVKDGLLSPKGSLQGGDDEGGDSFDENIVFQVNDRLMANVLFPHKKHTYWLDCKNCHDSIFKAERGANDFTMYDIWEGKFCGRCHGKVAFQPKGFENCQRCHSVKRTSSDRMIFPLEEDKKSNGK